MSVSECECMCVCAQREESCLAARGSSLSGTARDSSEAPLSSTQSLVFNIPIPCVRRKFRNCAVSEGSYPLSYDEQVLTSMQTSAFTRQ